MATLTIRNLDDPVKQELRLRAARHGRSMEEEARVILRSVLEPAPTKRPNPLLELHRAFVEIGGVDLPELPRGPMRPLPDFSE
jgi:plasmid stability protein